MVGYIHAVLFQLGQEITVAAKENLSATGNRETRAMLLRQYGIHAEQECLKLFQIAVLSVRQSPDFLQDLRKMLPVEGNAGCGEIQPFPGNGVPGYIQ